MTPALIRDLPLRDYLALPGAHFSTLKAMDTSPLHHRHACDHDSPDTAAFAVGRVCHAMILTPDAPAGVAVYDGKRIGKRWEEFEAEHGHKTILTRGQLEGARAMREAVMRHPEARRLLARGDGEVTLRWTMHGIDCKGRLDWLTRDGQIVEVKTTRTIHPRAFAGSVARYMYHAQLAFYNEGLSVIHEGVEPHMRPLPALISVENIPPHDVCVYRVGYDALEAGERKVVEWLRTLARCQAAGTWPGVGGDGLVDLRLPDWALSDGDDIDIDGLEEA